MIKKGYHTQEKWAKRLTSAQPTTKDNAWMGVAQYFWTEENDAMFWGTNVKKRTGKYEVYSADIDCSNVLDTVFNEEHYLFWIKQIDKAATKFIKSTNIQPSLKEINDYFKERGVWGHLDGIMFQDISRNPIHFLVEKFQYKKRIQIAVYNDKIITNFVYHDEGYCL